MDEGIAQLFLFNQKMLQLRSIFDPGDLGPDDNGHILFDLKIVLHKHFFCDHPNDG